MIARTQAPCLGIWWILQCTQEHHQVERPEDLQEGALTLCDLRNQIAQATKVRRIVFALDRHQTSSFLGEERPSTCQDSK
jgi:hypothetical protein